MKFLLALFILIPNLVFAAPVNLIVLRHGEKAKGDNPDLTPEGKKRAESLARLADVFDIKAVYSSDVKRTIQTGTPLATALKLTVNTTLGAKEYKKILDEVSSKYAGKTVVIVGHSNTIPGLVNAAIKEEKFKDISESDYSNFFLIQYDPAKKSQLLKYKYTPQADGKLLLEPAGY